MTEAETIRKVEQEIGDPQRETRLHVNASETLHTLAAQVNAAYAEMTALSQAITAIRNAPIDACNATRSVDDMLFGETPEPAPAPAELVAAHDAAHAAHRDALARLRAEVAAELQDRTA
ncbi:hypothetical protein [Pikeienuella sp. HZG-20]|uniref:hypothetical protein n=1 Tax=Paludibacillus litoralis TaxID=3133267 RepID=UPI0030EB38F9